MGGGGGVIRRMEMRGGGIFWNKIWAGGYEYTENVVGVCKH